MKSYKEVEKELDDYKKEKKSFIKINYTGFQRFIRLVWFNLFYVWKWLFVELHDWHFTITFIIVCSVVGITVWLPYTLALIVQDEKFKSWCLGIATGSLFFWNCIPFTPYIAICIVITMGIQELKIKIRKRKIILDNEIYDNPKNVVVRRK